MSTKAQNRQQAAIHMLRGWIENVTRCTRCESCRDAATDMLKEADIVAAALRAYDPSQAQAEIDAAWFMIDKGWDIESRAELEKQAKTNGFKFGLAQAIHHLHKRCVIENPDFLRASEAAHDYVVGDNGSPADFQLPMRASEAVRTLVCVNDECLYSCSDECKKAVEYKARAKAVRESETGIGAWQSFAEKLVPYAAHKDHCDHPYSGECSCGLSELLDLLPKPLPVPAEPQRETK